MYFTTTVLNTAQLLLSVGYKREELELKCLPLPFHCHDPPYVRTERREGAACDALRKGGKKSRVAELRIYGIYSCCALCSAMRCEACSLSLPAFPSFRRSLSLSENEFGAAAAAKLFPLNGGGGDRPKCIFGGGSAQLRSAERMDN